MGREEGGGFRMGNTCIPVADSFYIWQSQYNILKLNKILKNGKKKPKNSLPIFKISFVVVVQMWQLHIFPAIKFL